MFIAHLPAGYLLASAFPPPLKKSRPFFMAGAIVPDLDMAWFHLVDGGAVHHHSYLTHRPLLWLLLAALGLVLACAQHRYAAAWTALSLVGLLHMGLDSVAGAIAWGWPFNNTAHPRVIVQPNYDWWVMSFLTHWTFLIEILICLGALAIWAGTRSARLHHTP